MVQVVYSCLFGSNLNLLSQDLNLKNNKIKYLLFTDQNIKSDFWDVIYIKKRALPDRKASRLAKISPTRWLPEDTDVSVYIDNSVLITGDILEYIKELKQFDFMLFKHPSRNNVKEEVEHLSKLGHSEGKLMLDMIYHYESMGFNLNYPLAMGGILVRNHKSHKLRIQEDLWLEQLLFGCERDQISLGFSLWQSEINYSFTKEDLRNNTFFKWPVK